jgi:hypothetical protein
MTVPLDRHYELELRATEERVPQIGRIVAAHLRHWKLDLHVRAVCRGIDELLTNVHRHVGPDNRCVVEMRWTGRHLTTSVEDNGPRLPRVLTAGGGGLARVAALSDSWGTCAVTGGKVVWFTRSVEAPLSEPRVLSVPPSLLDAALAQPVRASRAPVTLSDSGTGPVCTDRHDRADPLVPTPA